MILDIARHKFYEGVIYLTIVAIAAVAIGFASLEQNVAEIMSTTAPLQPAMRDFMLNHPVVSALISFVLIFATSLRLTRATITHSLFSVSSLATMSLSAVVILGVGMQGNMLATLAAGYLLSEAVNRICYCTAPEPTLHYMFTASIALGAMPLFDSSMLAPALIAPVVLLISNNKPREILVAYIGLLLPTFVYSYIVWCGGGSIVEPAVQMWQGMLSPSGLADGSYLSIPRLIMLGSVVFVQVCTSLIYLNDRLSISLASRQIWRVLQIVVAVFTACFVMLPSTSPASFMCIGLCISMMAPLMFFKIEGVTSMIVFYLLLGIALWAI